MKTRPKIWARDVHTNEEVCIVPGAADGPDFRNLDLSDVENIADLQRIDYELLKSADLMAFKISLWGWLCFFKGEDVALLRRSLVEGRFLNPLIHLTALGRGLYIDDRHSFQRSRAWRWLEPIEDDGRPESCVFSRFAVAWIDELAALLDWKVTAA